MGSGTESGSQDLRRTRRLRRQFRCQPHHAAERGRTSAHAIRMALEEARMNADGVDLHQRARHGVLKDHARRVAISSTKSMHGYAMGAAAAIEFVATVMAMERSIIPPRRTTPSPTPSAIWTMF